MGLAASRSPAKVMAGIWRSTTQGDRIHRWTGRLPIRHISTQPDRSRSRHNRLENPPENGSKPFKRTEPPLHIHRQTPLRCLPGPDQTQGRPTRARRSCAATTPIALPCPGGNRDGPGAGAGQSVRLTPPDPWRVHRPSYRRSVRGRKTAAARTGTAPLAAMKREPGKKRIGRPLCPRPTGNGRIRTAPRDGRATKRRRAGTVGSPLPL